MSSNIAGGHPFGMHGQDLFLDGDCYPYPYFVVVPAVAKFFIQLRFQTGLHELGNGLFEQVLNIFHAADIFHL